MKLGGILLLLFFTLIKCNEAVHNNLEEQLLRLFKVWKMGDLNILPFTLPSLNLIKIPPLEGDYQGNGIKLSYSIGEMELSGLNSFIINELHTSERDLEAIVNITIPAINLYAEKYKINGRAYYVYPLKGSGPMTIGLHNVTLILTIHLTTNETSTSIDNLQCVFEIDKVEANLVDSSWPINKVLSSDGANLIGKYHDDINAIIHDYIIPYANKYLATVTSHELLNTIL